MKKPKLKKETPFIKLSKQERLGYFKHQAISAEKYVEVSRLYGFQAQFTINEFL